MKNWPEVIVLRHGETVWNRDNRMQGALNSPLTETGRQQASRQGELLSQFDLSTDWVAFCSPQGRAFQTAGLSVALHIPFVRTDDRLREIGVGEWSGKFRSDLKVEGPSHDGPDGPIAMYEQAPGGEGFDALNLRCQSFLDDLKGPTVIVTHGITSRMLRINLLGLPRSELGKLPGGQGNLFHIKDGVQKEIV
ncbi:probable phosphoglycerate mutase [Cognatiyoonia sediminum]|uniref:Probable phosphoglycerate mutase n=1 Tax=Cognatiyoonia sediminum TaxID=1508389 RepID=A0A1M5LJ11_9RHOB|nr:histidine phosphatase family protein [Cognatiyoonia sediminum]SHG65102.1 probable phosphoglycerate mutase [Cognatiyoonia sediminum]